MIGPGGDAELELAPAASLSFEAFGVEDGTSELPIQLDLRTQHLHVPLRLVLEGSKSKSGRFVLPPGPAEVALVQSPGWRFSAEAGAEVELKRAQKTASVELRVERPTVLGLSRVHSPTIRCVDGEDARELDHFRARIGSLERFGGKVPDQWFDFEWIESRRGRIAADDFGPVLVGETDLRLTVEAPGFARAVDDDLAEQLRQGNDVTVALARLPVEQVTFVRKGDPLAGLELELRTPGGAEILGRVRLDSHGDAAVPLEQMPFELWAGTPSARGLGVASAALALVRPDDVERAPGEVTAHLDRTARVTVRAGRRLATELVLVGETSGPCPLQVSGDDLVFPLVPAGQYFLGHVDEAGSLSARSYWGEHPWWLSLSEGEDASLTIDLLPPMGGPMRELVLDVEGIDPAELVVQPIWSIDPERVSFNPAGRVLAVDHAGRVRLGGRGPVPPNVLVGRFGSYGFVPLALGRADSGIAVRVAEVVFELSEQLGDLVTIQTTSNLGRIEVLNLIQVTARGGESVSLGALPVGAMSARVLTLKGAMDVSVESSTGERVVVPIEPR
ncbi:hypothetical protein [Engelhardtia mirabilis]|uniref:Uncharacterized protein n=1 Tax=Engelhardtia mirabilis TaxID=2528011 RepID=A0A518BS59_9BACT|nr:hypothetical protein Pla133_49310 [Planctomycetes bacterium Pla133]QDV04135.1 hypothetical protein Pla86_49290 [Planctomycetes bacterium Pla86]